ncbi:MAG: S-layer homology domain-containing protein [Oscillibacter sp.]|nr:S-layer homology domain-containing protein [Oscillibacter sp.]
MFFMRRITSWLLAAVTAVSLIVPAAAAPATGFSDVPAEGALAAEVQKAVDYGLMNGYNETTFGYSDTMTRAQFVTVVGRMMGWIPSGSTAHVSMWLIPQAMQIPQNLSNVYKFGIEQAQLHDAVDNDRSFRPSDPITRAEMAEILTRALGLKGAATMAEQVISLPFTDVTQNAGYIAVAYEIGMTKGTSATTFSPNATATRAQAAAMLVRIYEKLNRPLDWVHGFYAISSYSQLDYAQGMDTVSAGWSRMTWDGEEAMLATTSADGNEFFVPASYQSVTSYMDDHEVDLNLNVFMTAGDGAAELLASPEGREQAVEQIIHELTVDYNTIGKNPYAGVTIDFEGLRSAQKEDFVRFLQALEPKVHALDKTISVCVSPVLTTGAYYDGYDYAAIGELADRVILMAYDYDARDLSAFIGSEYYKANAPTPMDQIFLSMLAITDEETGVADHSKIALGFSSKHTAWQIDGNNKLVSGIPIYPDNATVYKRLQQSDTTRGYSNTYQSHYAVYSTESGERYFLWYDDVQPKVAAAKLLDITGVSVWRLGTMPMYGSWNWTGLLHG